MFIKRTRPNLGEGRTVRNISYRADTRSDWVGETDAIEDGDIEITKAEYDATVTANNAYNGTLPPPPHPFEVPGITPIRAILLKDDRDITPEELKRITLWLARTRLR